MIVPGKPDLSLALSIFYANVIVNVTASILTLLLIWYMHRNGTKVNLYIKCVVVMTIYQLAYDGTLYPIIQVCGSASGKHGCTAVASCGQKMGGAGAATWSIMIMSCCWWTAERGMEPSKRKEMTIFFFVNFLLLAYGAASAYQGYHAADDKPMYGYYLVVYNYLRLALIGASVLIFCRLYYILTLVSVANNRQRSPLYHLLRKIVYYPLVQCMTRLGTTPYNLTYKSSFSRFPENASTTQTVLCYMSVLLAPSAGLGAFCVFLHMQTGAKAQLLRMLRLDFSLDKEAVAKLEEKSKKVSELRNSQNRLELRKGWNGLELPFYPSRGIVTDISTANDDSNTPPWADWRSDSRIQELTDYTYDERESQSERESSANNERATLEEDWNRLSVMNEDELEQYFLADKIAFEEEEARRSSVGVSDTGTGPRSRG